MNFSKIDDETGAEVKPSPSAVKFVFDFDRVLFDTDRLKEDLIEKGLYTDETVRDVSLLDTAEQHGIRLHEYVQEGVIDFLREHGDCCVIVSSFFSRNGGSNEEDHSVLAEFQMEKIKRSGIADMVQKVEVTPKDKGEKLQEYFTLGAFFLDDEAVHIRVGIGIGYESVWMRTAKNSVVSPEGMPEHVQGAYETPSFRGFIDLVTQWKNEQK